MSGTAAAPAAAEAGLAVAWRLLSLALAAPTGERLAELRLLGEALQGSELARSSALDPTGLVEAAGAGESVLAPAYQRLFGGKVRIAPYEGSYEADPFRAARVLADVAGFYRAFGAGAHGPAAERADHAGCELEFLAFLSARRLAAASPEEAERCRTIEDAFLAEHAGRWLPAFFRELAAAAEPGFYSSLGRLGEALVLAVLAARELEPARLGPRPRRLSVEGDALECGGGT
jgi:TorA maturation chaperone TorD